MNLELKSKIYKAIRKTIEDSSESDLWEGYIPPTLYHQMTNAAEASFDACMDGQAFYEKEQQ